MYVSFLLFFYSFFFLPLSLSLFRENSISYNYHTKHYESYKLENCEEKKTAPPTPKLSKGFRKQ